ncbi:hypothetical protein AB0K05_13000 [Nonomuraea sp. NPDC049486]|uniref:hypothetical protein n=1 Tax=Nonomuraea sp. NPDC049486 TaxID=3155773 RepID=UPI0034170A6F
MNSRESPPAAAAPASVKAGHQIGRRALVRVRLVLARLEERICREEEDRAARRGWQITRTGFAKRCYRDPRFGLASESVGTEEATR